MNSEILTCWTDGYQVGNETYTIASADFNCAEHFLNCECPPLQADPDVAGVGVVVAYVVSATLTLLMSIMCLLLSRSNEFATFNPIDRALRQAVCRRVQEWLGRSRSDEWSLVLHDMVICLSDQQVVTGIALLVACIKLLSDSSITVYHFTIASDLVWFSSNTHLLSLLVIRSFDKSVKPYRLIGAPNSDETRRSDDRRLMGKYPKIYRAVLMVSLAGMLLYVSWVSGYVYWYDNYNCPAKCTVPYEKGGEPLTWTIINFVLILTEYPTSLFMLWTPGRVYWMNHLRHKLVDKQSLETGSRTGPEKPHEEMSLIRKGVKGTILGLWYLITSETWEVLIQVVWHGLGYWWLFTDRTLGQSREWMTKDQSRKENGLSFGQLVPLFLLLLLIMQLLESVAERHRKRKH
ncbi:hypothetical protein F4777DRAFT_567937 [Nemania sp. FL0916]|nr:hypothetical protein F4777DRAFT_567937 [Nemania sp. FL0916]